MPRTPKYCHHKATNQAYISIKGRVIYLGAYNTEKSRDAYDAAILKWKRQADTTGKHATTVSQLCIEFLKHADQFYRDEDGNPTGEAYNYRKCLRLLVKLFRNVPCSQFGPLKLQELQQAYIKSERVRTQVNKAISRVKSVFRWGVAQEIVPAEIVMALDCVKGIRRGRSQAKESEPIQPVPEADLQGAITMMTKNVAAIVKLLLLTGARVSEVRTMRVGDIDTSGDVWFYRPKSHKNAWRGRDRTILIGPKGQAILMPFIADAVQADLFVFRAVPEVNEPYALRGLGTSIRRACMRAGVNHWSPGQLRHNAATDINREAGDLDASRVVLGHEDKKTTEIYAERDLQKAAEIIKRIG